jgi:hypothetical protein
MDEYRRILELAAQGALPGSIDESSELPIHVVRELVEAGHLAAADASSFDGIEYLDPRITLSGREYLRTLQQRAGDTDEELLRILQRMRDIMVSAATGDRPIDEVNPDYCDLYAVAEARLRELGISNPNPFANLWDWYGRWSSGDLPSYRSRREFLAGVFNPLVAQLRERGSSHTPRSVEPTGWVKVDRQVGEARQRLAAAKSEEQFQVVGLLCREVIVSLAQTVHDPVKHPPLDSTIPSATDAKRMLDAYIAAELSGSSNEELRRHAKAAYDLATALQHKRTASFREAALCLEATTSVVNVIAIISGKRDPGANSAAV